MSVRHEAFERKTEKPKEKVIRWRLLTEYPSGDLMLCVVDEAGNIVPAGRVLGFRSDGRIERVGGAIVPGLETDDAGRAVIS